VFNPNLALITNCDRTNIEMRGMSPKVISGDSRRSENAQTHHVQAYKTIHEVQV
jgi:hypothetical protein